MTEAESPQLDLNNIRRWALRIGVGAGTLSLIGLFWHEQFFKSYLVAFMFWFSITLGCFAILMLQHLTGGAWGLVIRRFLECGTRMIPLVAILFVPLLFGMHDLYTWTHHHEETAVASTQPAIHASPFKDWYLSSGNFIVRAVIYFGIWGILAYVLNHWSKRQDETGDNRFANLLQTISGPGLILYGVTVTFASIDWVMSIDPHWYSTVFGIMFMVGQALGCLAFMIALVALLWDRPPLKGLVTHAHLHDLGNLLLAFTMLWAYIALSQFLIIWSANIAEETPWYVYRTHGGWQFIALMLIILHFAVPFMLLLNRRTKRSVTALRGIAVGILVMRLVDLLWIIKPSFAQAAHVDHTKFVINVNPLDLLLTFALGGLWIGAFIWQLERRPLVPLHDPRLAKMEDHHHG